MSCRLEVKEEIVAPPVKAGGNATVGSSSVIPIVCVVPSQPIYAVRDTGPALV